MSKALRALSQLSDVIATECDGLRDRKEGPPTVRTLHLIAMLDALPSLTDAIMVKRNTFFMEDYDCLEGRTVFVERTPDNYQDFIPKDASSGEGTQADG